MKRVAASAPAPAALLAILVLAALLRLPTLGSQGFWFDEQVTVSLVGLAPLDLLREFTATESNPPLFYLAQAAWERLFGSGEAAMRSLSALAGIATVPALFAAAKEFAGRRAGLIAAGLAATSPMLVWYSQEARNYALFCLLSALAFVFFARAANRPADRQAVTVWALLSALALCTHYFAVFSFVPQLGWLAWRRPALRARLAASAGAFAVVGLALLPTLAAEVGRTDWIAAIDFADRLAQLPLHFLAGMQTPWQPLPYLAALAVLAVGIGSYLLRRRPTSPAGAPLLVFAGGLALLLMCAAVGEDYVLSRNAIALWVPLAVALSVLLAEARPSRVAVGAAVAICALGAGLVVWTAARWEAHRPDFRPLASALGEATEPRVIVSQTSFASPLELYLPATEPETSGERAVRELVVIEPRPIARLAVGPCWWLSLCGGADRVPAPPYAVPEGFVEAQAGETQRFEYSLYRSARPRPTLAPVQFPPRAFVQIPAGAPSEP